MNPDPVLRQQLQAMVEKAHRALAAAVDHLRKGDYDFAASKAYYAVFHILQAVLLTKGQTFASHSGVTAAFSEHFVKAGTFPSDFGALIRRLRRHRELGDYTYQDGIAETDAQQDIRDAETVVTAVETYLRETGYLAPP